MEYKKHRNRMLRHILASPFIYLIFFPLLLLDASVELYHQVGFRLCGIPMVRRSAYIRIDRHKLRYLGPLDKLNCSYCGYANGLAAYMSEIAARTERYFCAIKHQKYKGFIEPRHHKDFLEYGDEKGFRKKH